ncbi:MAG: hypothetical protein ACRD3W_17135 [Terriglobales bacterium]
MKLQSPSSLVVHPNFRRLLLPCLFALALLALVRPGFAQATAQGKTAEVAKDTVVATASSGLEASLGTAELPSPFFAGSCPFVKCWITCDNGQGHNQYFTSALACYSYSNGGCHAAGLPVCSATRPLDTGC